MFRKSVFTPKIFLLLEFSNAFKSNIFAAEFPRYEKSAAVLRVLNESPRSE
jgi:hypothetical protein